MARTNPKLLVETAKLRVQRAQRHLDRQREAIAVLERAGQDATTAKRLLKISERALATHAADRDRLTNGAVADREARSPTPPAAKPGEFFLLFFGRQAPALGWSSPMADVLYGERVARNRAPAGVVTGAGGLRRPLAPRPRPAHPSTRTSAVPTCGSAFTSRLRR